MGRDLGLVETRLGLLLGFAFYRYLMAVSRFRAVLRTNQLSATTLRTVSYGIRVCRNIGPQ